MNETAASAWHEPPTGFFGRMAKRAARLLATAHPDAGLAASASPAGEAGLGSRVAHDIAETARAVEAAGASVARQAARAAETCGPTVLKAAGAAAADVAAAISVLSLSGDPRTPSGPARTR